MPTRYDIAKRLYGRGGSGTYSSASGAVTSAGGVSVNGSGSNVSVRYGTATSDSEDGWVWVRLDTSGISGEDAQDVHCVCDSPISEGQRVCVLFTTSGTLRAIPIGDNIVDQIGTTVVDTTIQWAGSDSGTEAPTDGWSQSWPSGSLYVWQRTMVEKSDGTITYSTPVCISSPQEGYDEDATFYATSSTSAATATKTATITSGEGFELETGVVVAVTFTYANTASSPRLNVASTGAKYIRTLGTSSAYWDAGQTVLFVYDGTYWQVASSPVWASTVTVGNPASQNVYIDGTHVAIRNQEEEFSSFDANSIFLGKSNEGVAVRVSSTAEDSYYNDYIDALTLFNNGNEVLTFSTATDHTRTKILTTLDGGLDIGAYIGSQMRLSSSGIELMPMYGFTAQGHVYIDIGSQRLEQNTSSNSSLDRTVCGAQLLYCGSTTGSVTLNRGASGFWRIDIYFAGGSRVQMASTCGSTEDTSYVYNCSGRQVSLVSAVADTSGSVYIACEYVTISGSTISRGTGRQINFSTGGWSGNYENNFSIVAVVGWMA